MSLVSPQFWVLSWTTLYMAGCLTPLVGRLLGKGRKQQVWADASILLALLGSLVGVVGAVTALTNPADWARTITLFEILPDLGRLSYLPRLVIQIRMDLLSSGFVLLIMAFAAAVAIYSFDALRALHFRRQQAWIAGAYNLFVWATVMVVIVNDLFSLIVALEIMTLAFGCLTLYKQELYQEPQPHQPEAEKRKEARLAPQIYLIVSHTSTAFLLVSALLLARRAGSFSYDDLRQAAGGPAPFLEPAIFLLTLAGLAIRAGMTPAHFWVSLVHPASATTTHAFSLGIAIKVAVYLMIRFFFQFLKPQIGWGYLVLGLAVVTAAVNVWYAIASQDLKRALAYHSIENVGIIVAGIGGALILYAYDQPTLATLALTASLYHLLNHAVFKGLLYLGTGAIERQTNQIVDMEHLGGLLKIWPWTSITFLIGALAITGFPPFNGFISEWLTLKALLSALTSGTLSLSGALILGLSLVTLVASFALTAFCFVKITGLTLLGQPRSTADEIARWRQTPDVPWLMRSVMLVLAGLCFLLGIMPTGVSNLLDRISATSMGLPEERYTANLLTFGLQIGMPKVEHPAYSMLQIIAVASLLGLGAFFISRARLRGRKKSLHITQPWNCGAPYSPSRGQYTEAALSFLIRDMVGAGWERERQKRPPDYLPTDMLLSEGAANTHPRTRQVVVEVFRRALNQVIDWLLSGSRRLEITAQNGDIRRYLLYILIANLAALSLFLILKR